MQQKTSYFNKTIFLKNITQFWPIWVSYTLLCIFQLPLRLSLSFHYTSVNTRISEDEKAGMLLREIYHCLSDVVSPVIIFIFAIITAMAVFSYLYNSRSANMIHAFPVRREELFFTNFGSGFLMMIIPQVLAFMSAMVICIIYHVSRTDYLLEAFLMILGMIFFAYSFAVFAVMITGHLTAAPIYFFILNFLYMICKLVANSLISLIAYGFGSTQMFHGGEFLSPLYYLVTKVNVATENLIDSNFRFTINGGMIVIYYSVAALFFAALALMIYQRKQLETAGDIISVPWMKPVFRWIAALISSLCSTIFFFALFFRNYFTESINFMVIALCILISGGILFFIMEMIIEKKFRVFQKARWIECGIYSAVVLLLLCGIEFDIWGMEKNIPGIDKVESIDLNAAYPIHITEADDMQKVLSLHEQIIKSKKEFEDFYVRAGYQETQSVYVTFRYRLKNGSRLSRSYRLPVTEQDLKQKDSAVYQLAELEQSRDYFMVSNFSSSYDDIVITNAVFESMNDKFDYNTHTLTAEQYEILYAALQKDITSEGFRVYNPGSEDYSRRVYGDNFYFEFKVPAGAYYVDPYGEIQTAGNQTISNTNISLTADFEHTIEALISLGLVKSRDAFKLQSEAERFWQSESNEFTMEGSGPMIIE